MITSLLCSFCLCSNLQTPNLQFQQKDKTTHQKDRTGVLSKVRTLHFCNTKPAALQKW